MAHGITSTDTMFSVRDVPWHGKGIVLETPPSSIDDALVRSGLKWPVGQKQVYVPNYTMTEDGVETTFVPALGFKANVKGDDDPGEVFDRYAVTQEGSNVLGVVTEDYKVVQNADAFDFLDTLLMGQYAFETAGSLFGGKRVWVLVKHSDAIEIGGDAVDRYIYVANSHDGSLALTASATPVRIVCANTLGFALSKSDSGKQAARTFRFRHTGNVEAKVAEARKVMQVAINYDKVFKSVGDSLALEPMTKRQFERKVVNPLFPIDPDTMGKRAQNNRLRSREALLDVFSGKGPDGDTRGNSPQTKWVALNAVGEYADWMRRYTKRTNQVARSFEDTALKDKALSLVVAA